MLDMGRVNKDGEPIRLGSTVAKKLVDAIAASKGKPFACACCSGSASAISARPRPRPSPLRIRRWRRFPG